MRKCAIIYSVADTIGLEKKMTTAIKDIDVKETARLIRVTLTEAFPDVPFSVRLKRYSGGCSIDTSWTDGPTSQQVGHILDRFNGKHFDGMTDSTEYVGKRMYRGVAVDFHSGYVHGYRRTSPEFLRLVAARVARECDRTAPEVNANGYLMMGHNDRVPFQWHHHWCDGKPLTMCDLLSSRPLLAMDSREGEYLSTLIDRVAAWTSLKTARPVELPEYIRDAAEVAA